MESRLYGIYVDEGYLKELQKKNNDSTHDYPPIWDETLKAWVNAPPHARGGQGAKE